MTDIIKYNDIFFRKKALYFLVFTFFASLIIGMLHLQTKQNSLSQNYIPNQDDIFPRKIAIGIVMCRENNDTNPREEASVLIKSLILSAKTYGIINTLDIYMFLEHLQDSSFYTNILNEFGQLPKKLNVQFFFKSAMDAVPTIYQDQFYHGSSFTKFRCAKLRIFFPSILPRLDAVLYLDIDTIITGNLAMLWNRFQEMDQNQLIGIANDYEDHSPRKSAWISEIPIPPPKGWNSGVLLMNLTKMREIGWEAKIMRIQNDYSKITDDLNDQQLINIFLYYNSQLLLRIPCSFNFRAPHCAENSICRSAAEYGVHIVHGAASHFSHNKTLGELYLIYKNANLRNSTAKQILLSVCERFKSNTKMETNILNSRLPSCFGLMDKMIRKIYNSLPNESLSG